MAIHPDIKISPVFQSLFEAIKGPVFEEVEAAIMTAYLLLSNGDKLLLSDGSYLEI